MYDAQQAKDQLNAYDRSCGQIEKGSTIVNYKSKTIMTEICIYYDSRITIYDRRAFKRMATVEKIA